MRRIAIAVAALGAYLALVEACARLTGFIE
jgi:hypothetical protein